MMQHKEIDISLLLYPTRNHKENYGGYYALCSAESTGFMALYSVFYTLRDLRNMMHSKHDKMCMLYTE